MTREQAAALISKTESAIRGLAVYRYPGTVSWANVRSSMILSAKALRVLCDQEDLPVELEDILAFRRVRCQDVSDGRSLSAQASLVPRRGGFWLLLPSPSAEHPYRRRATIAHEIGHTFFYVSREARPYHSLARARHDKASRVKEEDICWAFARELLMPEEALPSAESCLEGAPLEQAIAIARKCQVSLEIALRRLLHDSKAFAACIAILAPPGRAASRIWGRDARRILPSDARKGSGRIKSLFTSPVFPLEPSIIDVLKREEEIACRIGAHVEWRSLTGKAGPGLIVFVSPLQSVA